MNCVFVRGWEEPAQVAGSGQDGPTEQLELPVLNYDHISINKWFLIDLLWVSLMHIYIYIYIYIYK